jgi:hypothetical protein
MSAKTINRTARVQNDGPVGVPVSTDAKLRRFAVVGHGCPRELVDAFSAYDAIRLYRRSFGISESRPMDATKCDEVARGDR